MLGPALERIDNEVLRPILERVFAVANRAGIIPPPPPEIQNQMMTIDFVSMLAQAQQATKAGSIERVLSLAGNMAGVIPGSTDKIDFDYALDKYSALLNNDPKMMRTADEVAKIREDRAHQEQAAQQAQNQKQKPSKTDKLKLLYKLIVTGKQIGRASCRERVLRLV